MHLVFLPLETNVVIHSAAAVRFDEPIRIAMEMNVIAVKEVIKLVRDMKVIHLFSTYGSKDPFSGPRPLFFPQPKTPGELLSFIFFAAFRHRNSSIKIYSCLIF